MLDTTITNKTVTTFDLVKEHFSTIIQWSFIASSLKRCENDRFVYRSNSIKFDRDALFAALNVIREADFDKAMEQIAGQTFDFSALRRFTLNSVTPHEIELIRSASIWV